MVRARGLWPRSLLAPPFTDADLESFTGYAQIEERREEATVDVTIHAADEEAWSRDVTERRCRASRETRHRSGVLGATWGG